MSKSQRIKDMAIELGFELVEIVPAFPVPDYNFFRWWMDQGYAASMAYLKRGEERRGDPQKILPGVRSLVCCGLNYYTEGTAGSEISRYARGEDYHEVVGERLKAIENFIRAEIEPEAKTKSYVDTGAILERSYAAKAGLGWIGKNSCLINNGLGSFFFLGEILTTLSFKDEEYGRPALNQCGTCTRCLDACPTQALIEPYVMDANRCISYLTIEYRGEFSGEQKKMVEGHLYGCDICQQVCPYNDRIPVTPLREFQPRAEIVQKSPEEWGRVSEAEFKDLVEKSAMNRVKFAQWRRNLAAYRLK